MTPAFLEDYEVFMMLQKFATQLLMYKTNKQNTRPGHHADRIREGGRRGQKEKEKDDQSSDL